MYVMSEPGKPRLYWLRDLEKLKKKCLGLKKKCLKLKKKCRKTKKKVPN